MASASINLVINGGFETGTFSGWNTTSAVSASDFGVSITDPHSGSYSAYFDASLDDYDSISQSIPTTVGETYTFTFWLDNDVGNEPNSFIALWAGTQVLNLSSVNPFPYTEYSYTETATTSTTTIEFSGYEGTLLGSGGTFFLDDVSVTSGVPEPATLIIWSLLGACGWLGMGVRQRVAKRLIAETRLLDHSAPGAAGVESNLR